MTRQPKPEYMERASPLVWGDCNALTPLEAVDALQAVHRRIAIALEDEAAAEECVVCAAAPPPDAGDTVEARELVEELRALLAEERAARDAALLSAEATIERLREELEDRKRSGVDWTAPDVDAWGIAAERHGLPSLRAKINGLFRRAEKAEAALAAEREDRAYYQEALVEKGKLETELLARAEKAEAALAEAEREMGIMQYDAAWRDL